MTYTINFLEPIPPYEDAIYCKPDGTIVHYTNGKWQPLAMSNTSHPQPYSDVKITKHTKYYFMPGTVAENIDSGVMSEKRNGRKVLEVRISSKNYSKVEQEIKDRAPYTDMIDVLASHGLSVNGIKITIDPNLDDSQMFVISDNMDFETDFGTFDNESPALPPIPKCVHDSKSIQKFTTFSFWQCDDCKEDLGDVK